MVGHQTLHHGAESDDSNKDAKQGERHAGEVGGDRGDRQDGKNKDDGEQEQIEEESGNEREGLEAGLGEQGALCDEDGQIEKCQQEKQFGGEQLWPFIGAREPELAVADQSFRVDNAGNQERAESRP